MSDTVKSTLNFIFHGCEVRIEKPVRGTDFPIHHQTAMINYFPCIPFDLQLLVAINESRSYTLTSAILKVDCVWHHNHVNSQCLNDGVTWPIQPVYWQHVFYSFLSCTGENHGKPCLVWKKKYHTESSEKHADKVGVWWEKIISFNSPY